MANNNLQVYDCRKTDVDHDWYVVGEVDGKEIEAWFNDWSHVLTMMCAQLRDAYSE